jgi:hypothetical protein
MSKTEEEWFVLLLVVSDEDLAFGSEGEFILCFILFFHHYKYLELVYLAV